MSRPTSSALNKLGALGGAPPTASRRPSTTSRGRTGTGSRTGTAYQMDAMKLALMDALVRKLRAKFPKDVKTQEVIGREVTAFMRADRETVSEADLTSLENKIAKLLKMGGGGEWGSVFEYEAAMHAEAETKKRTNKVETAKRMKAELDKQMAEQQAMRAKERKEEAEYAELEARQREEWAREEAAKANKHANAIAVLKSERDKQLAEQNARRDAEASAKAKEESNQREEARLEAKRLREQEAADRTQQKENGRKLLIINEEVRLSKLEQKKKETELDLHYQQKYSERLDQQEKARTDYMNRLKDKMDARVGKAAPKPGRLYMDDEMVQMYQEKFNREKDAEVAEKQRRVEDSNAELRRVLAMQLKDKQVRKQTEAEREKDRVSKFLQEIKSLEQAETNKQDKLADLRLKHKLDLEAQMAENFARRFEQSMSDTEKSMNKELLSKARAFAS